MNGRNPIVRQAAIRLVLSLGLFVALIAATSAGLYHMALEKAAAERSEDMAAFYRGRLDQLEREWEIQSRDFKVRIEFTRLLEAKVMAKVQLQAFITIQGTDRRFHYLLIQTRDGRKLFDFGKDLSLPAIPLESGAANGHYLDQRNGLVYRVFQEPIWLGEREGMGRIALFFRMDHALLNQIGAPDLTLTLLHGGQPMASSRGQTAMEGLRGGRREESEARVLSWSGQPDDPLQLHLEAPLRTLFSTLELTTGISVIPVVDALILWFTIGLWLLRQTRRITALGRAVQTFSVDQQSSPPLREHLTLATRGQPDEIGEVATAIQAMVQTIGERERQRDEAIQTARESEARIREITATLASGLYVVDREGLITFVNPEAQRVLGWSEGEMVGRSSHALFHHHRPDGTPYPASECPVHTSIISGELCRIDGEHLLRRDGTPLPVAIASSPIRHGEGVSGAVIVFDDISERLRTQRALEVAKSEAEAANRAKSEFLANMSHEIRTPMNAILGLNYLLEQTELTTRQRGYVESVRQSANSLLGILNDILDFSKVEAGRLEVERVEFPLERILDNLATLASVTAARKEIEVNIHLGPEMPATLVGDPLRLEQVLINLVNNAVKFTERGEVVVSITALERGDGEITLAFAIRDTGIGISPEQQEGLFRAFSQADGSTTRRFGGTGLGLIISKRLVELMGGTLTLSSRAGSGSTFTCIIPFGLPENTPQLLRPRQVPVDLRVLVVDDNSTAREVLGEMVRSLGWHPELVASGEEALEALRHSRERVDRVDLVLLDWKMPGLDGLEIAHRIRTEPGYDHGCAIVMVTAYGREQVLAHPHAEELAGLLVKPILPGALVTTVQRLLGHGGPEGAPPGTAAPAPLTPLRGVELLLVEDNPTNQEVAREILENLGARVEVAGDGARAVALLSGGAPPPDAILMDVQMPELDGYQATGRIRALEGYGEVPIIAMTAHALSGDREKCLEAGMNDYVTKPVEVANLLATLGRWLPLPEPVAGMEAPPPPSFPHLPHLPGIDTAATLVRLGGNTHLLKRLVVEFREQQDTLPATLRGTLEEGDGELGCHLLHTLKGAAANLGANEVARLAGEMERAVREQGTKRAWEQRGGELTAALNTLFAAADILRVGTPPPPTDLPAPPEPETLSPLIGELEQLLADHSFDAVGVCQELVTVLAGTPWEGAARELEQEVYRMEFTRALPLLTALAEELGIPTTPSGRGSP